jgi:hypothetical protein
MPTAAEVTAEALVFVQAQAEARRQIEQVAGAVLVAEVRSFGSWYSHAAIASLAARLSKVTRAAQKQTASSTDVFARGVLRLLTGRPVSLHGTVDVSKARPVQLESVYGRLSDQYRWLEATRGPDSPVAELEHPDAHPLARLSEDEILDRIVIRGLLQLDDNLSLAMRDQWAANLEDAPASVVGYRRVLHPELSDGGSCGLCVVASDRQYGRGELLPLHGRCKCSTLPIILGSDDEVRFDPGQAINGADLKRVYGAAGGATDGRKLKRTRVRVEDHGELGPRLVAAGDDFRGPADVSAN